MGFVGRTDLPDFHVYTIEETYPSTCQVMSPYTLRFYSLTLHEHSEDAQLELNAQRVEDYSDTIAFQPPGHVAAWIRGARERGYILYFQPEFLSESLMPLHEEFPFLRPSQVVVLALTSTEKAILRQHFAQLGATYQRPHPYRIPMLQLGLRMLLFECKAIAERQGIPAAPSNTPVPLIARFRQAIDEHYLTRQRVQDYADLLGVTPNYLSQIVSATLGQRAYDLIMERVVIEAQKLLRYTDLSSATITNYLGFAEPTHFARFFKHRVGLSPSEYRHRTTQDR